MAITENEIDTILTTKNRWSTDTPRELIQDLYRRIRALENEVAELRGN
jgi:uncharacterized protein YceH (UPF0502 family)